jgi:hypothetical protein
VSINQEGFERLLASTLGLSISARRRRDLAGLMNDRRTAGTTDGQQDVTVTF